MRLIFPRRGGENPRHDLFLPYSEKNAFFASKTLYFRWGRGVKKGGVDTLNKFIIASRIALISVALYGIFQICELLKPQMKDKTSYFFMFIALMVFSFASIIDWNIKASANKTNRKD